MKKRNFSAEFKRESAQLVVDQKYTVADAAKAMDVGLSTMTRWVKQLRDERQGKTPKASPITPEQIEIRKLGCSSQWFLRLASAAAFTTPSGRPETDRTD
ncbi:transposase [Escherichia coli]|nr:transposase [Escherichia coli]KAA2196825.1 transposase [Escherichia coli]